MIALLCNVFVVGQRTQSFSRVYCLS